MHRPYSANWNRTVLQYTVRTSPPSFTSLVITKQRPQRTSLRARSHTRKNGKYAPPDYDQRAYSSPVHPIANHVFLLRIAASPAQTRWRCSVLLDNDTQ